MQFDRYTYFYKVISILAPQCRLVANLLSHFSSGESVLH